MTFRYKKILEKENEKPTQVIKNIITADNKCEKKGTEIAAFLKQITEISALKLHGFVIRNQL